MGNKNSTPSQSGGLGRTMSLGRAGRKTKGERGTRARPTSVLVLDRERNGERGLGNGDRREDEQEGGRLFAYRYEEMAGEVAKVRDFGTEEGGREEADRADGEDENQGKEEKVEPEQEEPKDEAFEKDTPNSEPEDTHTENPTQPKSNSNKQTQELLSRATTEPQTQTGAPKLSSTRTGGGKENGGLSMKIWEGYAERLMALQDGEGLEKEGGAKGEKRKGISRRHTMIDKF